MASLNEMFGCQAKGFPLGMSTYSEREGGLDLSYQLAITVNAKVDNLSLRRERNLVSYMTSTLGYGECVVDKRNNTIYVFSLTGINPARILKFVKHGIDSNARQTSREVRDENYG